MLTGRKPVSVPTARIVAVVVDSSDILLSIHQQNKLEKAKLRTYVAVTGCPATVVTLVERDTSTIVIVSVTVVGGTLVVAVEDDVEASVIVLVAPPAVIVVTEGITGPGAVGLGRITPPEPIVTVTIPEDTDMG